MAHTNPLLGERPNVAPSTLSLLQNSPATMPMMRRAEETQALVSYCATCVLHADAALRPQDHVPRDIALSSRRCARTGGRPGSGCLDLYGGQPLAQRALRRLWQPRMLTLTRESSISAPALLIGPGFYLAWTGTDTNHFLNLMSIEVTSSGLTPGKPRGGQPRSITDRATVTVIVFVLKSGIPWEMLPQELGRGSGMTCWRRLRNWQHAASLDNASVPAPEGRPDVPAPTLALAPAGRLCWPRLPARAAPTEYTGAAGTLRWRAYAPRPVHLPTAARAHLRTSPPMGSRH